ncbi:MAG: ketoacyl-ACP synthase III [Anaerolineales bacterium]|nr:ketoacyl-ACP synthase III [Anaerolineales bacterium]
MAGTYGKIVGWGAYAPDNVVTNHDLAQRWDTSHEWIVQRTGIEERRFARPGETTHQMGVRAARRALAVAGVGAADLDLIIVATTSPDYMTPPLSSQVQATLGADGVPAFQLMTGCSGFMYALTVAYQFIGTGAYGRILVVAAEMLSRFMVAADRTTGVLFGDAAGAVVIEATERPCGLLGFDLGSDGASGHNLVISMGESDEIETVTANGERYQVYMNGREVFKFATRIVHQSCYRALAQAGLTLQDVDWIVPHQANMRIIQAAARAMDVPVERFLVNIARYANTSAASVPLVLVENLDNGTIKPTDTVLMVAFGAGLTWGTAVVQLQPDSHEA